MIDCGLGHGINEEYRLVQRTDLAYAMVPQEPIREGHILVVPKSHAKLENLTLAELDQIRNLIVEVKNRIIQLFPTAPPYLYSVTDTPHASIPDHFHFHLLPYEESLRTVLAQHSPSLARERQKASVSELERMALRLRPEITSI